MTWKHDSFWSLCLHAALLLFAVPVRAQVGQKPPAMGIPESPNLVGDTTALAGEAQGWLAELIKINTTNPPGNEQAAAKYIGGILSKEASPSKFWTSRRGAARSWRASEAALCRTRQKHSCSWPTWTWSASKRTNGPWTLSGA